MRLIRHLLIIYFLLSTNLLKAGDPLYWLTFGHSKYIFSPGIELSYLFHPNLGVNLGLSTYVQHPDHLRLTNIIHQAPFGFYSANLGLSGYVYRSESHSVGIITGFKIYYGPDYRKLRYHEDGGYYIYYDGSSLQPDYGIDLGLFYRYKKFSLLFKWDFARNRFRIGMSYWFHLE